MHVVSWNIDGLCEESLGPRTRGAVTELLAGGADVVCLQEVVPESLAIIRSLASERYQVLAEEHQHEAMGNPYFVAVLVRRGAVEVRGSQLRYFSNSVMGRHWLRVDLVVGGRRHTVVTSHLESTAPYGKQRVAQLQEVLAELAGVDGTAVFVGDTNMRDSEVPRDLGGFVDAWQAAGADKQSKFTWDLALNKNVTFPNGGTPRLRFDRAYVRGGAVATFRLVGLQRLPCGMHPSDHFGIAFSVEEGEARAATESAKENTKPVTGKRRREEGSISMFFKKQTSQPSVEAEPEKKRDVAAAAASGKGEGPTDKDKDKDQRPSDTGAEGRRRGKRGAPAETADGLTLEGLYDIFGHHRQAAVDRMHARLLRELGDSAAALQQTLQGMLE